MTEPLEPLDMDDTYDYEDDKEFICEGCGRSENDAGHCPLCCEMGSYSPGTEESDFCEYSDECAKHVARL